MKNRILIIVDIFLILIVFKMIYNVTATSALIDKYENEEYDLSQAKSLTNLNFWQSYIANYNYGNVLYQSGEYEKAITEYQKALSTNVPKYKECSIRINYALSICQTVKVDEKDQDSIENAIKTYESAIDVLTEDGCANENNSNGHSEKAEQLKEDILDEIERLKNMSKDSSESKEDEEEENQEKNKTEKEIESIETKIQEIKESATKDQRTMEQQFGDYNKEYNMNGKNW